MIKRSRSVRWWRLSSEKRVLQPNQKQNTVQHPSQISAPNRRTLPYKDRARTTSWNVYSHYRGTSVNVGRFPQCRY
jgi:hypothetical protein